MPDDRRRPRRAARPAPRFRSGIRHRRQARAGPPSSTRRQLRAHVIVPSLHSDEQMIDSEKYASAVAVARRVLCKGLWILRLKPEVELPYRPGQYVTIGLPRNGRVIERPYSICSAPTDPEIELFIERVPEGELSHPLYELDLVAEMVVRRRAKEHLL